MWLQLGTVSCKDENDRFAFGVKQGPYQKEL